MLPVGMAGQGLLLVERQVGELHLALLDRVEQRQRPVAAARAARAARRGGRRASARQAVGQRRADVGRFALAERFDQAAGQSGEVRGVISSSSFAGLGIVLR